jgi:hypothetical protein
MDLLAAIIDSPEVGFDLDQARAILRFRFTALQLKRMRELADRNNRVGLTPVERAQLDSFLRVGDFLDRLQAKARAMLKNA